MPSFSARAVTVMTSSIPIPGTRVPPSDLPKPAGVVGPLSRAEGGPKPSPPKAPPAKPWSAAPLKPPHPPSLPREPVVGGVWFVVAIEAVCVVVVVNWLVVRVAAGGTAPLVWTGTAV
jgi:hypothetical protein